MKKRILFLAAALVIGSGAWAVIGRLRPDPVQQTPPRGGSADTLHQQEPVGWVFGRLIGVQHSVYAPSGQGVPVQVSPLPSQQPSSNQP